MPCKLTAGGPTVYLLAGSSTPGMESKISRYPKSVPSIIKCLLLAYDRSTGMVRSSGLAVMAEMSHWIFHDALEFFAPRTVAVFDDCAAENGPSPWEMLPTTQTLVLATHRIDSCSLRAFAAKPFCGGKNRREIRNRTSDNRRSDNRTLGQGAMGHKFWSDSLKVLETSATTLTG